MKEYLEAFQKEPIAILAGRFFYRGIVDKVSDDAVILSHAAVVLDIKDYTKEDGIEELKIPGTICIKLSAIEMACSPEWAKIYTDKQYEGRSKKQQKD